jgi:hypothetical protein
MGRKKKEKVKSGQHPFWALLSELKAEEFDKNVTLSIGDMEARLIATWPKVTRTVLSTPFENKNIHEAWNYIDFYAGGWAKAALVDEDIVWKKWQGLANTKLIYPDGTYPDEVRTVLLAKADALAKLK